MSKPIILTPSEVVRLFRLSPANGAEYREPEPTYIKWPSGTFLQKRLAERGTKDANNRNGNE